MVNEVQNSNQTSVKSLPHLVFHIVNSIKGGSGKSTLALLLAAHYAKESINFSKTENTTVAIDTETKNKNIDNVFVIDIDLCGSSWKHDYCKISNETYGNKFNFVTNPKFINDWMYEGNDVIQKEDWPRLKLKFNDTDAIVNIPVFLADPSRGDSLTECELDLFENTIYRIINSIWNTHTGNRTFHIIIDMPPSYESHAERIHNHLLLDNDSSPLYKDFRREYNKDKDKYPMYQIRHYLVSAISVSHIYLNINYLTQFSKAFTYSTAYKEFLENNGYTFFIVLNDYLKCVNDSKDILKQKIDSELNNILDNLKLNNSIKCKVLTFPHVDREYTKLLLGALISSAATDDKLPIGAEELNSIGEFINKMNE